MTRSNPLFDDEMGRALHFELPDDILRAAKSTGERQRLLQCGDGWRIALKKRHRALFEQLAIWKAEPNLACVDWARPRHDRHWHQAKRTYRGGLVGDMTRPPAWTAWLDEQRKEPDLQGPWSTAWLIERGFSPAPPTLPMDKWPLACAIENGWKDTVGLMLNHCREHHYRWPEGLLEKAMPFPEVYAQLLDAGALPSSNLAHWKPFFATSTKNAPPVAQFKQLVRLLDERKNLPVRQTSRSKKGHLCLHRRLAVELLPDLIYNHPALAWEVWRAQPTPESDWVFHFQLESRAADTEKPLRARAKVQQLWDYRVRQPGTGDNLAHALIKDERNHGAPIHLKRLQFLLEHHPILFQQKNSRGQLPMDLFNQKQRDEPGSIYCLLRAQGEKQRLTAVLDAKARQRVGQEDGLGVEPPRRRPRL